MTYTIEAINFPVFKKLYQEVLVHDFPRNELRPLWMFRSLFRKNDYTVLVMEECGRILAYACIIVDEVASLLDYFAVNKDLRGSGIGSVFLSELKHYLDCDGLIIESEQPDQAKNNKEKETRTKRVSFYEKNGALLSPYHWHAFGVDYHLLYLPLKQERKMPQLDIRIKRLYRKAMPKMAVRYFTSIR